MDKKGEGKTKTKRETDRSVSNYKINSADVIQVRKVNWPDFERRGGSLFDLATQIQI